MTKAGLKLLLLFAYSSQVLGLLKPGLDFLVAFLKYTRFPGKVKTSVSEDFRVSELASGSFFLWDPVRVWDFAFPGKW